MPIFVYTRQNKMEYNIHITDDIDKITTSIIEKYWKYNNGEFSNTNLNLSKQFDINITFLIQIVKSYSYCEIIFDKCKKCNLVRKYSVKTRVNFEYVINNFSRICNNCNEYKVLLNENHKLYKANQYNTEYAIQNKVWKELLPIELEVLKGLINYKRKDLIYKYVFKNDTYNTTIWNIINHLEYLGLIFIKRTNEGKILSFNVYKKVVIHLNDIL